MDCGELSFSFLVEDSIEQLHERLLVQQLELVAFLVPVP